MIQSREFEGKGGRDCVWPQLEIRMRSRLCTHPFGYYRYLENGTVINKDWREWLGDQWLMIPRFHFPLPGPKKTIETRKSEHNWWAPSSSLDCTASTRFSKDSIRQSLIRPIVKQHRAIEVFSKWPTRSSDVNSADAKGRNKKNFFPRAV